MVTVFGTVTSELTLSAVIFCAKVSLEYIYKAEKNLTSMLPLPLKLP